MGRYVKHEKSKECVSMWIKLNNKNNYKFVGLKVEDKIQTQNTYHQGREI